MFNVCDFVPGTFEMNDSPRINPGASILGDQNSPLFVNTMKTYYMAPLEVWACCTCFCFMYTGTGGDDL